MNIMGWDAMRPDAGTYALVLRSSGKATVQVGRWRRVDLERGYYVYVGSAFGPGGVRGRVLRHLRRRKSLHWHIDYVIDLLSAVAVWYSHASERLEHRWAAALCDAAGVSPIRGFGCSDCRCHAHLFHASSEPGAALLSNITQGEAESRVPARADRRYGMAD